MREHRSREKIGDLQRQGRAVFVLTSHKITNLSRKRGHAIMYSRSITRDAFLDTRANRYCQEKRLSLASGTDVQGMRANHKLRNALNKTQMSNDARLDQIEC